MDSATLIAEGRRLAKPCALLLDYPSGPAVAQWWAEPDSVAFGRESNECRWLTLALAAIPNAPPGLTGFATLYTDWDSMSGRVEITPDWPEFVGEPFTLLYAHEVDILPPIEVLIEKGSPEVADWFEWHGAMKGEPYSSHFSQHEMVQPYEDQWYKEYPIYVSQRIHATLGGWHFAFQEEDWHENINNHLLLMTFRHSEPWVEVWLSPAGEFRVIQRIT